VARLQLDHAAGGALASLAEGVAAADDKARRAAAFASALETAATLQRRKAAGTLLGASCTAAELAWRQQVVEAVTVPPQAENIAATRAFAPLLAQLLGYETLLLCAADLLEAMQIAGRECELLIIMTAEQVRTCWSVIADAVDCMALPHICMCTGNITTPAESTFVRNFRAELSDPRCIVPCDGFGARLRDAWQRLESSGLLQLRNLEQMMHNRAEMSENAKKAAAAASADPSRRRCALASCGAREAHPSHFKSCAACRIAAYCSRSTRWQTGLATRRPARRAARLLQLVRTAPDQAALDAPGCTRPRLVSAPDAAH
jgi:hypothetical protein